MAIDKIKLRRLARDKDERLFKEGDMLDALNVVVSADGVSSDGVVKNTTGTLPGSAATTADQIPNEEARVVGSVADPARGFVYFFVWSTTAANHAIYQYNTSNHEYKVVLRNVSLDFQKYGFVKADIINGEFQKDEVTQTLLYFTDGVNPPRKINVDRVLDGDILEYSDAEIEEMLLVIKSPSLLPPTARLETDTTRTTNNLYGSVYQFAVQYVYKDGESSALSPHSKVVYPKYMSMQGLDNSSVTQDDIQEENYAVVDTRWRTTPVSLTDKHQEISKIRLLGRTLNTSAFFVIDEFDPNEDVVRSGQTLYSTASGLYNFYNDGLYINESVTVTDKVYDDVPQKAESQAISGNRMMYSAPTAGYPNTDVTATISVTYHPEADTGTYLSDTSSEANTITHEVVTTDAGDGWIEFDTSGLPATLNANTSVTISFDYKPTGFSAFGYYDGGGGTRDFPIVKIEAADSTFYCGEVDDSQNIGTALFDTGSYDGAVRFGTNLDASIDYKTFSASIVIDEDDTAIATYLGELITEMKQQYLSYKFRAVGDDIVSWYLKSSSIGDTSNTNILYTQKLDFDIAFTEITKTGNKLKLYPKPGNFYIPPGDLANTATLSTAAEHVAIKNGTTGQTFLSGTLDSVTAFYQGTADPRTTNGIVTTNEVQDAWDDYDIDDNPQIDGAKSLSVVTLPLAIRRTFKSGCSHEFGVVYFDKDGRPGYVNELGSVYVQPIVEDSARDDGASGYNLGPCDISIDITSDPPDWATSYQIVYPGMGTYEKFETYSLGGLFKVDASYGDAVDEIYDDSIYISLNTLADFQTEKGALKDYTFTEGDKLRLVSYRADDNSSTEYFSEEYIFDIVGYETILDEKLGHSSGDTNNKGKFLRISNIGGSNFEDTNFNTTSTNYWGNQVVAEILTPRKNVAEKVYYEIGESRKILSDNELSSDGNNTHNDGVAIVVQEGDVYYRPMALKSPNYANNDFVTDDKTNWVYLSKSVESMDASDFVKSRCWSRGRAHVKYDKAATIKYYNRIVYSDEFGDDIGNITFSSFNPGSFSYKNMPKKYGSVNYIHEYNQNLVCLQENKLSYIPVNRNIIEYADGDSQITTSSSVLGTHQESNGDFGVGSDASSVVVRDGMVFFVDASRQKVLMAVGSKLLPISDADMSSYFEDELDLRDAESGDGGRIVGGYEPEEDMFLITIEPKGSGYSGTTVGYSVGDKAWISRYSFTPSNYATIDNLLLSGSWYQNADDTESYLMNAHRNTLKNTFYGTAYNTEVEVVSKMSPSEVKVFNAVSYEGDSSAWDMTPGMTTDLGQTSGTITTWKEKEGAYYAAMPKDTAYKYVYIGTIASDGITVGNGVIQLADISRLDRFGFKVNAEYIYYNDDGTYSQVGLGVPRVVTGFDLDAKTVTTALTTSDDGNGNKLYFRLSTDGNAMRGRWGKIRLVNSSTSSHELYAINTHVAGSKLHHPKGQQ